MTNNDDLALNLKAKASLALDAWNKFVSLPDDVDLERGLSLYEMSLLSAHDAAANPANILSLLAERDADKKRIAEQAARIAKLERELDLARNSNSVLAIRSELEARTLTVKLPRQTDFDDPLSAYEAIEKCREGIKSACAAAGIKLDVGE